MNASNMRVSDAERAEVADRLAAHFADGLLDQAEYDERIGRAMSAKTRADFEGLFDDLPGTGAPAGADEPRPQLDAPRYGRRRHRPLATIGLVVLLLIVLSAAGHVAWWFFSPGWIFVLVVVFILAARRHR